MTASRFEGVRTLHPAYFALVMATGIVSIAAKLLQIPFVPGALLVVNVIAFIVLWTMTITRLILFRREFIADLIDHQRGVGFFTAVAATSVFGSQCVILLHAFALGIALWWITLALWIVLIYSVFTALTVKTEKPSLEKGISGGWLVAVVATESVATLGALIAPSISAVESERLLFLSLTFWLAGGMLYVWLISLIFYRYMFFRFEPTDLMPPYWINMGAMAISTLAGALLTAASPHSVLLGKLTPFLLGFTFFFWATATWWIPMLIILGFWRHGWQRLPVTYNPLYWGAVFPLGMYTVCTWRLAEVAGVEFLKNVPRLFVFVALGAWTLTFIGLLRQSLTSVTRPASALLRS